MAMDLKEVRSHNNIVKYAKKAIERQEGGNRIV